MKDGEGRGMRDDGPTRRLKVAMAHSGDFVQILTIAPSGGMFSPEERKALFFPRISWGRLHPTADTIPYNGVKEWSELRGKSRFWAILANSANQDPTKGIPQLALTQTTVLLQSPHPKS